MYNQSWHIIKDDTTRTFEAVTKSSNDNAFTNKTYAMQKDGMNVSCVFLPVSNKVASKDAIKIAGYVYETGLYEKLLKKHQEITLKHSGFWEE
jgi:hypothetical protein